MKKIFASVVALATTSLLAIGGTPAAAYSGAASWSDAGLRTVVEHKGQYSWSIDGLGTMDGTGDITVDKPAGATVYKAYFMAAQVRPGSEPTIGSASAITINTNAVTFDYESQNASLTEGNDFNNYFADVTSIVKPIIDAAGAGTTNLTVDEGGLDVEGTALIVIFNNSSVDIATIIIAFGNSSTDGDEFTLAFPALTTPQTADLQMSIGDSYSYQLEGDSLSDSSTQVSTIHVNGELLSDVAGGFDECEEADPTNDCNDGSLISVGGVGDSLTNPTTGSTELSATPDDELYSLSPFVEVGDTELIVETRNQSADDNIFFDAFYLKHIEATVSVASGSGSEPLAPTGGANGIATGALVAGVGSVIAAALVRSRRRSAQ